MESVIEYMMGSDGRGVKRGRHFFILIHGLTCACTVLELVKPPDLNQARVNKCLIALVNRKVVHKDNSTVCLNYLSEIIDVLTNASNRAQSFTVGTDYRNV